MTTNTSHKATIAAYESELKIARSLLELQQRETVHGQEHISLLNAEADSLRAILAEKQSLIAQLNSRILAQEEKIAEFERSFDEFYVDKRALEQLEQQNAQLLLRLQEKQSALDEMAVENRFLRIAKDSEALAEEARLKSLAAMQIVMPIENSQLAVRLEQAHVQINELQQRIAELESINENLRREAIMHENLKLDQLARSKKAEYAMLLQLDRTERLAQSLEMDKDSLQSTTSSLISQSNFLQRQCIQSQREVEKAEVAAGVVVDYVERDIAALRESETRLQRENLRLRTEAHLLGEIVSRSSSAASLRPHTTSTTRSKFSKRFTKLSPLNTTGTISLNSTFPNNEQIDETLLRSTATLDRTLSVDMIELNFAKKEIVLSQLELIRMIFQAMAQKSLPQLHEITLKELLLVDEDVDDIITQFRRFSFQDVEKLNLSNNRLTSEAVFKLLAWILAMPNDELFGRPTPLTIDLSNNEIKSSAEDTLKKGLLTRAEFRFAESCSEEDKTLIVYDENRAVLRINLNNQRTGPKQRTWGTLTAYAKHSLKEAPSPSADSMRSEQLDIYPRDHIMRARLL